MTRGEREAARLLRMIREADTGTPASEVLATTRNKSSSAGPMRPGGSIGGMGETTQDLTPPVRPAIASLLDVRPGDLIFTQIRRPLAASLLVKAGMFALAERVRIGRRSFDHVIVVVEAAHEVSAAGAPFGQLLTDDEGRLYTPPIGVQAMPGGAERVTLTPERHWHDGMAVVRLPAAWPGQAADAAAIAELMADARTPYSFASYLALALWRFGVKTPRLEAWIDRRAARVELPQWSNGPDVQATVFRRGGCLPAEAICSVLADQCWSLAGGRVVEGVAPQAVSPGRLVLALWRRPGAIWGGPGILG